MTDPTVMFFDQYQRYHTAADMIHKSGGFADASPQCAEGCGNAEGTMRGEIAYPLRILEVGANEHRDLGKFLPDADVVDAYVQLVDDVVVIKVDNRFRKAFLLDTEKGFSHVAA